MCGIFACFSHTQSILDSIDTDAVLDTITRRGPDSHKIVRGKNYIAIHTLLSMTGNREQPIILPDGVLLFNGEIYNDWDSYDEHYSDADYLEEWFWVKPIDFDGLDGEYAIVCSRGDEVILMSDPHGTKPLHYMCDPNYLVVGSYRETVKATGLNGTIAECHGRGMTFSLKDREYDFYRPYGEDFTDWNRAFSQAITKRCRSREQIFVMMSAGHDSGLIVAECLNQGIPFKVYTVPYEEDEKVLNQRLQVLDDNHIPYEIIEPTRFEYDVMRELLHEQCEYFGLINTNSSFRNFANPDYRDIPGYVVSGIIQQKAQQDGRRISLSGQGVDEIHADYFNPPANPSMSDMKGDWSKATEPWPNVFGGWNRVFLQASERVAGNFGIETRYPFLDRDVVQEFLHLTTDLKGSEYKAPITARLRELHFPFHMGKQGFAGVAFD